RPAEEAAEEQRCPAERRVAEGREAELDAEALDEAGDERRQAPLRADEGGDGRGEQLGGDRGARTAGAEHADDAGDEPGPGGEGAERWERRLDGVGRCLVGQSPGPVGDAEGNAEKGGGEQVDGPPPSEGSGGPDLGACGDRV